MNQANPVGAFLQGQGAAQQNKLMQMQQQGIQQSQAQQAQTHQADMQGREMEAVLDIGRAVAWAETPEQWDQVVDFYSQNGMPQAEQYRGRFDLRPALAGQLAQNIPAGLQEHQALVAAARSEDPLERSAARIQLGLDPRASSAGAKVVKFTGSDGRERAYVQQADGSLIPASEQIVNQAGGLAAIPSVQQGAQQPASQQPQTDPFTSRAPEEEPPKGYQWRGEGEERRLVPVEGSPDDRDRTSARRTRAAMFRGRVEPFVRDAQRALNLVESAGPFAGAIAVPPESEAGAGTFRRMIAAGLTPDTFELNQHLESLKSNISIEQLQQMRESSPTGGALGQIPVRQQQFLMQMEGALNAQLKPDVLRENIAYVSNNRIRALAHAMYGDDQEIQEAVMDGRLTAREAEEATRERDELIQRNLQDQEFSLFPEDESSDDGWSVQEVQ